MFCEVQTEVNHHHHQKSQAYLVRHQHRNHRKFDRLCQLLLYRHHYQQGRLRNEIILPRACEMTTTTS